MYRQTSSTRRAPEPNEIVVPDSVVNGPPPKRISPRTAADDGHEKRGDQGEYDDRGELHGQQPGAAGRDGEQVTQRAEVRLAGDGVGRDRGDRDR